jgi:glycine amidinotransferase
MKIHSYNEWDPLRSVVVGRADHANWPVHDPVFSSESERTLWKETPVPSGPVPDWIIREANEDLDALVGVLRSFDVEVFRPDDFNFQVHDGMYNYCPRDRLLVYGDTVVNPAMMCKHMDKPTSKERYINTYKILLNAGMQQRANYLRSTFMKNVEIDLASEPMSASLQQ